MELDWERLDQAITDAVVAPPNMGTVAEARSLVHNTDAALSAVIANVLQGLWLRPRRDPRLIAGGIAAQKDGSPPLLPRHVTMAELRTWQVGGAGQSTR